MNRIIGWTPTPLDPLYLNEFEDLPKHLAEQIKKNKEDGNDDLVRDETSKSLIKIDFDKLFRTKEFGSTVRVRIQQIRRIWEKLSIIQPTAYQKTIFHMRIRRDILVQQSLLSSPILNVS